MIEKNPPNSDIFTLRPKWLGELSVGISNSPSKAQDMPENQIRIEQAISSAYGLVDLYLN